MMMMMMMIQPVRQQQDVEEKFKIKTVLKGFSRNRNSFRRFKPVLDERQVLCFTSLDSSTHDALLLLRNVLWNICNHGNEPCSTTRGHPFVRIGQCRPAGRPCSLIGR